MSRRGMQSTAFERPMQSRKYIGKRLWIYLAKYRAMLVLAVFLTVAGNGLALLGPKLSGYAIDVIGKGKGQVDFEKVFYYAGTMILLYLCSSLIRYGLAALMVYISRKIVYQMRTDVYHHLMKLQKGACYGFREKSSKRT